TPTPSVTPIATLTGTGTTTPSLTLTVQTSTPTRTPTITSTVAGTTATPTATVCVPSFGAPCITATPTMCSVGFAPCPTPTSGSTQFSSGHKTSDSGATDGQTLTYSLIVRNDAASTISGISLS